MFFFFLLLLLFLFFLFFLFFFFSNRFVPLLLLEFVLSLPSYDTLLSFGRLNTISVLLSLKWLQSECQEQETRSQTLLFHLQGQLAVATAAQATAQQEEAINRSHLLDRQAKVTVREGKPTSAVCQRRGC